MNKRNFRGIVILNILLMVGFMVASFLEKPALPSELARFVESRHAAELTSIDHFFLIIDLIGLSSIVGLLFFANWARITYSITMPVMSIAMYFDGPSVTGPISTVIIESQLIINGVILALLFCSPISSLFKAADNRQP